MDVGRRGFLSLLSAAGASLVLPKYLVYDPAKLQAATALGMVDLQRIVYETAKRMNARFVAVGHQMTYLEALPGAALGATIDGAQMTRRFSYSLALPQQEELDIESHVVGRTADNLAERLVESNITKVSDLYFPPVQGVSGSRVSSKEMGLSLRCLLAYDTTLDMDVLRFDVIGGAA